MQVRHIPGADIPQIGYVSDALEISKYLTRQLRSSVLSRNFAPVEPRRIWIVGAIIMGRTEDEARVAIDVLDVRLTV